MSSSSPRATRLISSLFAQWRKNNDSERKHTHTVPLYLNTSACFPAPISLSQAGDGATPGCCWRAKTDELPEVWAHTQTLLVRWWSGKRAGRWRLPGLYLRNNNQLQIQLNLCIGTVSFLHFFLLKKTQTWFSSVPSGFMSSSSAYGLPNTQPAISEACCDGSRNHTKPLFISAPLQLMASAERPILEPGGSFQTLDEST